MKNTSPDNVVLPHFSCSEYKPPSSTLSARLSGEILLTLAQVTAGSWPGAGVSHYTHYTSLLSPANIATQTLLSAVGNKALSLYYWWGFVIKNSRAGLVKKCRFPRFPRAFLNGSLRIRWAKIGKSKQISTVQSTKNEDRHWLGAVYDVWDGNTRPRTATIISATVELLVHLVN